jgi:hypothetical protein
MIRLTHTDDVQKFALTLTELSTLANPVFLFVFTSDVTKEEQKIILPDLSEKKTRYNLFQIAGNYFTSEGWHTYKVYEQISEDNLDPALTTGVVEEGRVFVDSLNDVTYIENITQNNFKEYGG